MHYRIKKAFWASKVKSNFKGTRKTLGYLNLTIKTVISLIFSFNEIILIDEYFWTHCTELSSNHISHSIHLVTKNKPTKLRPTNNFMCIFCYPFLMSTVSTCIMRIQPFQTKWWMTMNTNSRAPTYISNLII